MFSRKIYVVFIKCLISMFDVSIRKPIFSLSILKKEKKFKLFSQHLIHFPNETYVRYSKLIGIIFVLILVTKVFFFEDDPSPTLSSSLVGAFLLLILNIKQLQ